MGNAKFSDDFKRDAVHQIVDRGIRSRRFRNDWVSARILYTPG